MSKRHPTTATWKFPPADRSELQPPLQRTNLRELQARPDRFEHHLLVVGRVGALQIEAVTASEPLFFAHRNISDEYVVPLETGDAMTDSFPFRTFIADFETGSDVGRIKHRAGEMVLHPHGFLHWPGRLRPPFATFEFAPGMRRAGVSAVFCASVPTPPEARPLFVSSGHDGDTKQYGAIEVPFVLADLKQEPARLLGSVGDVSLELAVEPKTWSPRRGGYALVLGADGGRHFDSDLIYVPAGTTLECTGIDRAILVGSEVSEAEPPPPSWEHLPAPPFAPFEESTPGELPFQVGDLHVAASASVDRVDIRIGEGDAIQVPRYWLARMLFRLALHGYQLGYLETYGGFYYDDQGGYRLGIRGGQSVSLDRAALEGAVEQLYRAVAPESYTERLA